MPVPSTSDSTSTSHASLAGNPFRLAGKIVLITGAGGAIGQALVRSFADAGARIYGADRDASLMDGLPLAGRLEFDLTDADACARAVGSIPTPDILVNNAGGSLADTLSTVDSAMWERELQLNLSGPFNVTKPVVDAMLARASKDKNQNKGSEGEGNGNGTVNVNSDRDADEVVGSVLFVASVNGLAHYGNPAYSAAKSGVIAYAKSLAVELGPRGIRSNVVCPGSVRTPAWSHRDPALIDQVVTHYPIGRVLLPEDIANASVFLASPLAAGINGAVLPVDGGLTAGNMHFFRDVEAGQK